MTSTSKLDVLREWETLDVINQFSRVDMILREASGVQPCDFVKICMNTAIKLFRFKRFEHAVLVLTMACPVLLNSPTAGSTTTRTNLVEFLSKAFIYSERPELAHQLAHLMAYGWTETGCVHSALELMRRVPEHSRYG